MCVVTHVRGPQDGAVPVAHQEVLAVLEAIAARLGAEALFALFELLEEAEVARHLGAHGGWMRGAALSSSSANGGCFYTGGGRGERELIYGGRGEAKEDR